MHDEIKVVEQTQNYVSDPCKTYQHPIEIANPQCWNDVYNTIGVEGLPMAFDKNQRIHGITACDLAVSQWSCGQLFSGIVKRQSETRPFTWSDFVKFNEHLAIADEIQDRFIKNAPKCANGSLQMNCLKFVFQIYLELRLGWATPSERKRVQAALTKRFIERFCGLVSDGTAKEPPDRLPCDLVISCPHIPLSAVDRSFQCVLVQ